MINISKIGQIMGRDEGNRLFGEHVDWKGSDVIGVHAFRTWDPEKGSSSQLGTVGWYIWNLETSQMELRFLGTIRLRKISFSEGKQVRFFFKKSRHILRHIKQSSDSFVHCMYLKYRLQMQRRSLLMPKFIAPSSHLLDYNVYKTRS